MSSPPRPHAARCIPSVNRLLAEAEVQALCDRFGRASTLAALREELSALRERLVSAPSGIQEPVPEIARRVESALVARRRPSLARVINATGVVLHTNLGRAPLAPQALRAVMAVGAGYCNLEYDLEDASRGSRTDHVVPLLTRLSGAEAALVVNNCAAAVLLALTAVARDGEVIASRGELVEIGGAFRVPEVIAQSGARLVEVGTTNRTRVADYERAITPATRALLRTHPSNYRIVGFTEAPSREDLARIAQRHGVPLVEDLGSGTFVDLSRLGLPAQPTVARCIAEGADLVCFSGDKLLGGPQAGIVVGRTRWIGAMRSHPLMRALRADKMTLAALEATLRLYEEGDAAGSIPALRMLGAKPAQIRRRAARAAAALRGVAGLSCELVEEASLPGGGSLPLASLPTVALRLGSNALSASALARACLAQSPPLVGRVREDAFVLDFRTVDNREIGALVAAVRSALGA